MNNPMSYTTTIPQTYDRHHDGTPYTRLTDVVTDGSEFQDNWDGMSEDQQQEANDWTKRLHQARVEFESLSPQAREEVAAMLEGEEPSDPENLSLALKLHDLLEGCRETYAAMTEEQQGKVDELISNAAAVLHPRRFREALDTVLAQTSATVRS
jgi:hypothetical protein